MTDDHQLEPSRGWRARSKYLTYRGLAAGMGHIPEPLAEGIARGVARVMALRGGPALAMNERHMRRVLASECAPGVEPDPALVQRWSRRTFDSYARYWCDGARLPYEREAGVRARFRILEGEEHIRAGSNRGRGVVMALPHVGSWEWGGAWLGLEGTPMTAVVERLEPEELFEWFVGQRAAMGLTAVPLGDGSSSASAAGAQGERDRRTGQRPGPGRQRRRGRVLRGEDDLAGGRRRAGPADWSGPAPGGRLLGSGNWHTGVVHPPLDTGRQGRMREDIARVTQDLATTFEHDIRARPEQWHLYQPNWPSDPR